MTVHALFLTAVSTLSSLEQVMMPFSLDVPLEQLFPSQIVLFWSSHFISKTTSSDFMSRQTAYMRMR
jgi:hypothetical protein